MADGKKPDEARIVQVLLVGLKMKKVMKERALTSAQAKCPFCNVNNALQARLVGRNNHLRLWCNTIGCNTQMME